MTPLHFSFPFALCVPDNQRHGVFRGRILLTAKYRKAKESLWRIGRVQYTGKVLEGRIAMQCTLYAPDKRRRDLGNFSKLVCDVLNRTAYADDSQIDDLRWIRGGTDKSNPRIDISLWRRDA